MNYIVNLINQAIGQRLDEIDWKLNLVIKQGKRLMTDADDLAAAVADLAASIASNNAEIEALLGKITAPNVTSAQVQAAVSSIRDLIKQNSDEVAKAQAAAP